MRRQPDHPRECGANFRNLPQSIVNIGSSPRVRGKLLRNRVERHGRRIIPASAGQTQSSTLWLPVWPDHPRECGANPLSTDRVNVAPGSSPRVRGKPWVMMLVMLGLRIIPASAGQTKRTHGRNSGKADHPRECGANAMLQNGAYTGNGSSPRVRGKPLIVMFLLGELRIIPASAGQTCCHPPPSRPPADHPRECGANRVLSGKGMTAVGSSPRVRGKPRAGSVAS